VSPFPAAAAADRPGPVNEYLPFSSASRSQQLAVASLYLRLQANCAPPSPDMPLVSKTFGYMPIPGEKPVAQVQLDTAMALAETFAGQDPIAYVFEGDPLPASASTGGPMSARRYVLIPDDVVVLADGRLGALTRVHIQMNHPDGAAGFIAQGTGTLELMFVVVEENDGIPVFAEAIPLCVGPCEFHWAGYEITPDRTPQVLDPRQQQETRKHYLRVS
jgi:hypothetical protein